jgi:hypothetical protein
MTHLRAAAHPLRACLLSVCACERVQGMSAAAYDPSQGCCSSLARMHVVCACVCAQGFSAASDDPSQGCCTSSARMQAISSASFGEQQMPAAAHDNFRAAAWCRTVLQHTFLAPAGLASSSHSLHRLLRIASEAPAPVGVARSGCGFSRLLRMWGLGPPHQGSRTALLARQCLQA